MLANFARLVAASSAERLVAFPRLIITSVKPITSSVAIPSCPAASATPAISVVVEGIRTASSFTPSAMA